MPQGFVMVLPERAPSDDRPALGVRPATGSRLGDSSLDGIVGAAVADGLAEGGYFSAAYSRFASIRAGTSGSASFQKAKKSW